MYIESVALSNVRTFGSPKGELLPNLIDFVHPDKVYRRTKKGKGADDEALPKPRLPNVNLLLGDNGSGKTTILRAIAAAAFGPAARDILRDPSTVRHRAKEGSIRAYFIFHEQDGLRQTPGGGVQLLLEPLGERMEVTAVTDDEANGSQKALSRDLWKGVYSSENDSFFLVGYGATRRVERLDTYDPGSRSKSRAKRDLRVQSLFEEAFSLIPLASWLPRLQKDNPGRYKQVVNLINKLIGPGEYRFSGKQDPRGDYLFRRGKLEIPFQSLSDGYRAFIGWIADLLHHVCFGCPKGKKLIDNRGVVLVDEVDLHLHPKWQMQIVETVASSLPNMQFIFTSHSPLVASSLEWMNIFTLDVDEATNLTTAKRLEESIHGLDADQVLLTDFFGLRTTRAPGKVTQLEDLQRKARHGDRAAARQIILEMSKGTEAAHE